MLSQQAIETIRKCELRRDVAKRIAEQAKQLLKDSVEIREGEAIEMGRGWTWMYVLGPPFAIVVYPPSGEPIGFVRKGEGV